MASTVRLDLPISGMTCAGCVKTVTEALQRTPGVATASVNFATRRASVEFDPQQANREKLSAAVRAAGYGVAEQRDESKELKQRLIIAAVFTVPLAALAMGPWMHETRWIQWLLATPVVAWCGLPFFRAAVKGVWARANGKPFTTDMNTLIATGTGTAYVYSAVTLLQGSHRDVYFESAAVIITFILAGRTLEERARAQASKAIQGLAELMPREAEVLRGGFPFRVPLEQVKVGDILMVRPGQRLPVDGVIQQGTASIDESSLTGEPIPVSKGKGDSVYAGTVNTTSAFRVEAKGVGRETMLSQIAAMVEQAQGSRAPIARLADEVSGWFTPAVIIAALVTLAVWLAVGTPDQAMLHFVAVLIVACPCALGLATPAAILVASGRAAQLGILFKGGEALEAAARIDTVIFDKTGTLTRGRPEVAQVDGAPETLALAAAVERWSEHPLAKAIAARAGAAGESTAFEALPGVGARAQVDGALVEVITDESRPEATWLLVRRDGVDVGRIAMADMLRTEAAETITQVRALAITPWLLSGDRQAVAEQVAKELGIANVLAPVLPHQKADRVKRLQQQGAKVAMVGDGINDAPALAMANLGIAIGTGTEIAMEAAHVTLISTGGLVDLRKVPQALRLARRTLAAIRQNLFWAFAYNVIGIPLAAGVLLPWTGLELSPMFAAAAMALSSVSVVANSLRLRRA
ncbi:MAG: copper-translocating P-type ATPase [Acidobacteria bacterium]|nr:copper-translocating P-type ATPase [Acidobacteriota bacterium]